MHDLLKHAARLMTAGYESASIDLLHSETDRLFRAGRFPMVDVILLSAMDNGGLLQPTILFTLATATLPAKAHLWVREDFLKKAVDCIDAQKLLTMEIAESFERLG